MISYRQISESLIQELLTLLLQGKSLSLLAHRFGGKRYVQQRLRKALEEQLISPLVSIEISDEKPIYHENDVVTLLRAALIADGIEVREDDPFEAVKRHYAQTDKRLTLFISNVDAIAHGLTRRLLQHLRPLVDAYCLTVVITGESDFLELVDGPKSEFNVTGNYFLQGFAEAEFAVFLEQYLHSLGVTLADPQGIGRFLWQRTGGNSYLVRPILVEVTERYIQKGELLHGLCLTLQDFHQMPNSKTVPGTYLTHLCRHATRLVASEPGCWRDLERLINGEILWSGLTPTALEWAGIVRRLPDNRLVFASEMMERYARVHYGHRNFGDLYLRNWQSEKAFQSYGQLPLEQKRRPSSLDDRAETEKNIHAFCMALMAEAAKGVEEVKYFFAEGCRHLLGFGEVTYWRREDQWVQRPVHDAKADVPVALRDNIQEVLSVPKELPERYFKLPEFIDDYALAFRVQPFNSEYLGAVVVSDLEARIIVSRERRRLLGRMLDHFAKAYEHAVEVKKNKHWLEVRNRQMGLINQVFQAMGSQVLDVEGVLKQVAAGLSAMDYERVLFCLVDPKRERIIGELDFTTKPQPLDVARMTDFALPDRNANPAPLGFEDIQAYVVFTGQPFVTADSGKEEMTNKVVVQATGMKGLAIVPMLNYLDQAIGTLHVEREDKLKPSPEEVNVLLDFGRLVATAIEQAERENLLQTTLDKIPNPVVIVDPLKRVRFANRPAASEWSLQSGWQERSSLGSPLQAVPPLVNTSIAEALNGERTFHHWFAPPTQQENSYAILADCVKDKQGRVIGAFFHTQELADYFKAFDAFEKVAVCVKADDAIQAMLEAVRLLGFQEGRLYLFDPETGSLKSRSCYGMTDKKAQEAIENGKLIMSRNSLDLRPWQSLENKQPEVFCYNPLGKDGESKKTRLGLEYHIYTVTQFAEILRKKAGDFWVDVPLLRKDGTPLGKISLPCTEDLRPEKFELLKVLSKKIDSGLFDNLLEREVEQYRLNIEVRAQAAEQAAAQAAEKVTADVAHNLATRMGSFPGYLEMYRHYETRLPELKPVNDSFDHALTQAMSLVSRAKDRLSAVTRLHPETLRLPDFLERFLRSVLPEGAWRVTCAGQHSLQADAHWLEEALSELVQNSKDAQLADLPVQVEIKVELSDAAEMRQVRLIYQDNGPGIAPQVRERVFEDFFSYHPGQERGSSGLGLAFVKRVIKAHGGHIELGVPKQGAEFIITLPQRIAAALIEESTYVSHAYR